MDVMPKWAEVVLVPLISLLLAAILSGLVILAIGEDPVAALKLMIDGALGSTYGWGYTLYYATNFMFTGLAVSVAFHARLFNIGGEGQAMLGGLGVALACLFIPWPHWSLGLLGAIVLAGAFGAVWGCSACVLASKTRQSHRYHDHYVQLHRSCGAELYAGQRAASQRCNGSCDRTLPRSRSLAITARYLGPYRH